MPKRETAQHRVACLLTRAQYEAIKEAADAVGLSLSSYMRQAAVKEATK